MIEERRHLKTPRKWRGSATLVLSHAALVAALTLPAAVSQAESEATDRACFEHAHAAVEAPDLQPEPASASDREAEAASDREAEPPSAAHPDGRPTSAPARETPVIPSETTHRALRQASLVPRSVSPRETRVPWSASPHPLLRPCLPDDHSSLLALETALDDALEGSDARCWSALEIALAHALLERSDGLTGDPRVSQRRLAAYRFRQAELRAARYAFDDLVALARHGRARVEARKLRREALLENLAAATEGAGLHAASTGEACESLDALLVERMTELLAAWERQGHVTLIADVFETAALLKAREALRSFHAVGVDQVELAGAAILDAERALSNLRSHSEAARSSFGKENREAGPARVIASEVVLDNGSAWAGTAPLLLGWLPGQRPDVFLAAQAVLGPGEVLLDYTVGDSHGILLALSEDAFVASPLPGRQELERSVASCREEFCQSFEVGVLRPAARLLEGARQVLVAAHGVLHEAPFEAVLDARVVRVPSAQGLAHLRLRAWDSGPRAQPRAAALLTKLEPGSGPIDADAPNSPSPHIDGAAEGDKRDAGDASGAGEHATGGGASNRALSSGRGEPSPSGDVPRIEAPGDHRGLAHLWSTLASGPHLVEWAPPGEPSRRFGAPLTIPAARSRPNPGP